MVDSRQEHIKLGTYPPEQVYQSCRQALKV